MAAQTADQPTFLIRPPHWTFVAEHDPELLPIKIHECWTTHSKDSLYRRFQPDSWVTHFKVLGFDQEIIELIRKALQYLEDKFSTTTLWRILGIETVENIALPILEAEAEYFRSALWRWKISNSGQLDHTANGEDTEDTDQDTDSSESSEHPEFDYNDGRQRMLEYAKQRGVGLSFLADSTLNSNPLISPPVVIPETNDGSLVLFHASPIKPESRDLFHLLDFFLADGPRSVHDLNENPPKSFLSPLASVYYSNSLAFVWVWSMIKTALCHYRQPDRLPDAEKCVLVAKSEIPMSALHDHSLLKMVRIPQDKGEFAGRFADRNLAPDSRRRRPVLQGVQRPDIVISPFPLWEGETSGDSLFGETSVTSLSFVAGCSALGSQFLAKHIKEYTVYGFGD
jgi:hypothetical protein